jgi:LemA protein
MSTTLLILAVLVATLLFWAVGAYNRLVRLRAAVSQSFSALDAVLLVQPALIQAVLPELLASDVLADADQAPWARLSSAGEQYARALAFARAQPLDPGAVSALCAAQRVLDDVWHGGARMGTDGNITDAGVPGHLQGRLARIADQGEGPREAFNASVLAYNQAVRQFPALLLARIWGFKPAAMMEPGRLD